MNNNINEENKKEVVCYIRSAIEDIEAIEKQENRLQKYCDLKGYENCKFYIDNGYSANNLNRPSYKKMIEDLKQGKFDKIVITRLDRISRNMVDFDGFIKLLQRYNCDIEIIDKGIDTSSLEGMLVIRLLDIFSQYEKELKKEEKEVQ